MAASVRMEERAKVLEHLKDPSVSKIFIFGESGMGKTFLARDVVNEVIRKRLCYETIWLSMNCMHQKRSVYETIARQLSLIPDYEEFGAEEREEEDLKTEIAAKLERRKESVENKFIVDEEKKFLEVKEYEEKKFLEKKESRKERFLEEETIEEKLLDDAEKKFLEEKETGEKKLLEEKKSRGKKFLEEKEYGKKEIESGEEKLREAKRTIEKKFLDKKEFRENNILKEKEYAEKKFLEDKETVGKKFLLLILDDEGNKTNEEQVMSAFGLRDFLENCHVHWKVLITRRTREKSSVSISKEIELLSLTPKASQLLFESFLTEKVSSELGLWVSSIVRKSDGVPARITVLAKSLSYVTQNCSKSLSPSLRKAFEKNDFLVGKKEEDGIDSSETLANGGDVLLLLSFQMLTSDVTINCLWQSLEFFEESGGAYYRDLINHWMLEGCFDPIKSIKTAYLEAYGVLMELLDRGMLKTQEDSMVVPEERMRVVFDLHPFEFFGTPSLRLAGVINVDDQKDLEKTVQIDDMIKTVTTNKISTVLVSGTRLRRETPEKFFEKAQDLEVLGLFEPAFGSLIQSISKLKKLRVLMIRDYDLLEDIDPIACLETLTALEVSGASALKEKPDDELFRKMAHLQSLNLSRLSIEFLPTSVSLLRELRWFVIRHCPNLKHLPNLQFLENLEVIDTCGSTSLACSPKITENINFFRLQKLQRLDFSQSKLDRLPLFQDYSLKWSRIQNSLRQLILRDCTELSRVPSLKPLSVLEVLDISGCVNIHEFRNECFEEKKNLKIINLSGTSIRLLPPTFEQLSNLREMILRECHFLTSLPNLEVLTSLEVLDASGSRLIEITGSFKFMSRLEKLNLSGTMVTNLPAFPKASNLRHLLLKDCCSLKSFPISEEDFPMHKVLQNLEVLNISGCRELNSLPDLTDSKKLELLDCSGCTALEINEKSFGLMPCLQKLDLSETKIKKASDIPKNCSELCHLSLQNCTELEDPTGVECFPKLKELNLGGTQCLNRGKAEFLQQLTDLKSLNLSGICLSELSYISKLSNLHHLSLTINLEVAGIEFLLPLKSLKKLEVLSLLGTTITSKFLNEIPEPFCVKRLILPELNTAEELNWSKIRGYVKEISWEDHCFSLPLEAATANTKPPLLVAGRKLLQLEKDKLNDLQRKCFEGFNIFVCLKEQVNNNNTCCPRELHGYEETFLEIRGFTCLNQHQPFLEIHGCDGSGRFPDLIKKWLSKAEYISFVDNLSAACSSILSTFELKAAKGFLLERCIKMKNLFLGEDEEATASQIQRLETLQISNLPNLTNICCTSTKPKTNMLQNLKKLTLECCPKMEGTVFQASQIPKGLEIIRIKFCDKLKKVFDEEECELSRLHTVILLSLPELSSVGAKLPRLEVFNVKNCPNLKDTKESLTDS